MKTDFSSILSILIICGVTLHSLLSVATASLFLNEKVNAKCESCNRSLCAPASFCNAGRVLDRCGCCEICGLEEGHSCNTLKHNWTNIWYGHCGIDLVCRGDMQDSWTCQCEMSGEVCASSDVTYSRCGMAAERMRSHGKVWAVSSGPCKTKPRIVPFPQFYSLKRDSIAKFNCEVEGHPLPIINWLYHPFGESHESKLPGDSDDMVVTLRGGPKKRTATSILQIVNLGAMHSGTYKCQADNDRGFSERNFNLTVL